MPTTKQRLVYTPTPISADAIRTIASKSGVPASRVLAHTVELLEPYLTEIAGAMTVLEGTQERVRQASAEMSDSMKEALTPYLLAVHAAVHDLQGAVASAEVKVVGGGIPPLTNRGGMEGTSHSKHRKAA